LAERVMEYMNSYLLHKNDVLSCRYENLISQPVKTILGLSEALGISMSTQESESISEQFINKSLGGHSHLFRPCSGKYKQYLSRKHRDMLLDMGYRDLMGELGYECDWDMNAAPLSKEEIMPEILQLFEDKYYFQRSFSRSTSKNQCLFIEGTSRHAESHMKNVLRGPTKFIEQVLFSRGENL